MNLNNLLVQGCFNNKTNIAVEHHPQTSSCPKPLLALFYIPPPVPYIPPPVLSMHTFADYQCPYGDVTFLSKAQWSPFL